MSARSSWMHLDLDAFFASVEQKLNSSLVGKPILVGRVDPHGRSVPRGVVATASYEARKFGAKSGMPLFQALRLCPQCIVVGGHYEEYIKTSDAVFSICARWAPKIQYSSLDEAFLDFSGTELIYPDLIDSARKIKETIKSEIGITASIGIAATKVVAKVASDYQKPDGLTYVPKGADNVWFNPRVEVKSVSRSETFARNSNDSKFILAMLQGLAEKVGAEMRREDYFGRCVYVTIRYADFRTLSRQRVLPYSTASTKEIFEMGKQLLKELWDGRAPLRLVGIGISQFGPPASGIIQPSLFDSVSDKRLELEKRIDTLRERFGKEAVI